MASLLISLSGAQPEILAQCPTERVKFQSLAWSILITSVIAVISMWFALSSALGFNPFLSLLVALIWGLIIMGIDRWLVISIPADNRNRFAIATPRLILALLLGTLISTPIILRVFQSEINTQISVIKEQRANAFLTSVQDSAVSKRVTSWQNQVSSLEKVINSRGAVPINPAADPQIQSLSKQLSAAQGQQRQYYDAWQCQLYGGSGCPKGGNGPLAQASHQSYLQATAQVNRLDNAIQQRENALSSSSLASQAARLQQAQYALPAAKAQLTTAQAQRSVLVNTFETSNLATNGLLVRLDALSQLSNNNFTITAARFLLFLLFLVIECLPVTVRLLQRPGNYELILATAADRELKDARRAVAGRPRAGELAASSADVRALWSHAEAVPSLGSGASAEPFLDEPEESDEHTRLEDEAMRMIEEVPADPSQRGGIELRYDDDDL
jgi:hypothetical protein